MAALIPHALLLLLAGCSRPSGRDSAASAPEAADPAGTWQYRTTTALVSYPARWARLPMPAPTARPAPPPADPYVPSMPASLLPALDGGRFDESRGTALVEAIADLPDERRALGAAGVDADVLFGLDGSAPLCEDPRLLFSLEHEGEPFEVGISPPWAYWMVGAPVRDLAPLPVECAEALLVAAGDIEAAMGAGCTEADARAFFPEGSSCESCLEMDGDIERCIDETTCPAEATRQMEAWGSWHAMLRVEALLCAPGFVGDAWILVEDLAEEASLPGLYEHGAVDALCLTAWDDEADAPELLCGRGDWSGIGDVLVSRLDWARPEGSEEMPHGGRLSALQSAEVEGYTFTHLWLSDGGVVGLSAPLGSTPDAWGIPPLALRPDGTDPENVDHTWARDYIAALGLKIATTRAGVPVAPINHNRCSEDGWVEAADGRWLCQQPGAWSEDGMLDDGMISWFDRSEGTITVFPLVTLGSTGLPDPAIPGGVVPRILSTPTLADPEWEDCVWPETFEPDHIRLHDPAPATSRTPYASFDGQTFRFGQGGPDLRLLLATSHRREFCPPSP